VHCLAFQRYFPLECAIPMVRFPLLFVILISGFAQAQTPHVIKVEVDSEGSWRLLRDNKPYFIRGACGSEHLDLLKQLGGNSIRTYGVDQLEKKDASGKNLLDQAEAAGLTVTLGIGVRPWRTGFDINDPAQVTAQRDKVLAAVRRFKNHPAVLMWSLGNEVELQRPPEDYPKIFAMLNELALLVKKEDPNHPVMTVVAGPNEQKLKAIIQNYPALDVLGMNAYADGPNVPKKLTAAGWTKPYVLTEFGPRGAWEVKKTAWGAALEPTTQEKTALYQKSYEANARDFRLQCLGSYTFKWGDKQEVTSTWMGMFLKSGEKTAPVDAISFCWTGHWPENRAPVIEKVIADFSQKTIAPGSQYTVEIKAKDADSDTLASEAWVMKESTKPKVGGDKEAVPDTVPGCAAGGGSPLTYSFHAPAAAGNYRLFVKVTDGQGGASVENVPFQVQ